LRFGELKLDHGLFINKGAEGVESYQILVNEKSKFMPQLSIVDFFHVGEYLGAAASVCAPDHPQAWLDVQQERLKANQAPAVLDALAPFVSAKEDDPVTACDRYLRNRLDQLDYQGAIQRGLPIGSGEIESAHRYIIQERLKLPGAWWSPDHIETMLALRLNRANREWEAYWQGVEKRAAGTGQAVVASH
jgi:hypothetical protein